MKDEQARFNWKTEWPGVAGCILVILLLSTCGYAAPKYHERVATTGCK